ncbi:ectoine/hydroxyectoine ABC transporter permease subunit EhuD [Cohnella cellulosilytica]|uniref:Ectoine/hydroxyectoine ABC transporter permease subunit EhuD n=1 Tax=Cohnella cellulosilytica TaxID=986710 RepID=A0ABW2FFQ9_9BACL
MWDWDYARAILPKLLEAIPVAALAAAAGFAVAALLGLPLALAKRSGRRWISLPVTAAAEFVRSTPLLVQLFVLVFVLPQTFGISLPPLWAGVLGLGIHYSTYLSEVYRSGIEAVPKGQWEAAVSLNFGRWRRWTGIVLPQSVPPTIPVMGNYLITMFKETPLLSAITVVELLMTAKIEGSASFRYVEAFTGVGVLFLALSYPSSLLVRMLEKRLRRRERRTTIQ